MLHLDDSVKLTPSVQSDALGRLPDKVLISTGDFNECQGGIACRTSIWLAQRLLNHDAEKLSYAAFQLACATPTLLLSLASIAAKAPVHRLVFLPCYILWVVDWNVYRPRRIHEREKEVDKLAMSMMNKAGYDPADLLGLYKSCVAHRIHLQDEIIQSNPGIYKLVEPLYRYILERVSEMGAYVETQLIVL